MRIKSLLVVITNIRFFVKCATHIFIIFIHPQKLSKVFLFLAQVNLFFSHNFQQTLSISGTVSFCFCSFFFFFFLKALADWQCSDEILILSFGKQTHEAAGVERMQTTEKTFSLFIICNCEKWNYNEGFLDCNCMKRFLIRARLSSSKSQTNLSFSL